MNFIAIMNLKEMKIASLLFSYVSGRIAKRLCFWILLWNVPYSMISSFPIQGRILARPCSSRTLHPSTRSRNQIILNHPQVQLHSKAADIEEDATSIPLKVLLSSSTAFLLDEKDGLLLGRDEPNDSQKTYVSYSSNLPVSDLYSCEEYANRIQGRQEACQELFYNYTTRVLRSFANPSNPHEMIIRWRAQWVPPGSVWLYSLATNVFQWQIIPRDPDPFRIATFRWKAVTSMLTKAVQTGVIVLPVSSVEGTTTYVPRINTKINKKDERIVMWKVNESIDLVEEANKLQNRKVAQELVSWLDVSRRPPNQTEDDWAVLLQNRILSGVPNSGALDVDPNEDDTESILAIGFILLAFAASSLLLSSQLIFSPPATTLQIYDYSL